MLTCPKPNPGARLKDLHVYLLLVLVLARSSRSQSTATDDGNNQVGAGNSTSPISETANNAILAGSIEVKIFLEPYVSVLHTTYVATNTQINISAIVKDSAFNQSLLNYTWSTKEGTIKTEPHDKEIKHVFTKSDEENFVNVVVFDPETNATGSANYSVIVKSPVVVLDPIGKTFLESGELLDIKLRYNGSPPFTYCYKFCSEYDFLPCDLCFPFHTTTSTEIPIVQYLHNKGNYTLLFKISNLMNVLEKNYAIKINDTVRKSNMPIAPIVSTMLAVIILMSGVALHLKFRDTSYTTETANFDFFGDHEDEDWEQEFSFIQRVKYLFCGLSDEMDEGETRYLLQKSSPASSSSSGHGTNATTTTTAAIIDSEAT